MVSAALIAACAAGARNRNKEQPEIQTNTKSEDKSCLIAVKTVAYFPPCQYYSKAPELVMPVFDEQFIPESNVCHDTWKVPEAQINKTFYIEFNSYYGNKYTLSELEQKAKDFITTTPQYMQSMQEFQELRIAYLEAQGYPITDNIKYLVTHFEVHSDTDICQLGQQKLTEVSVPFENIMYYYELY